MARRYKHQDKLIEDTYRAIEDTRAHLSERRTRIEQSVPGKRMSPKVYWAIMAGFIALVALQCAGVRF